MDGNVSGLDRVDRLFVEVAALIHEEKELSQKLEKVRAARLRKRSEILALVADPAALASSESNGSGGGKSLKLNDALRKWVLTVDTEVFTTASAAAALDMRGATVSQYMTRFVNDGLIDRKAPGEFQLTEQGRRLADAEKNRPKTTKP